MSKRQSIIVAVALLIGLTLLLFQQRDRADRIHSVDKRTPFKSPSVTVPAPPLTVPTTMAPNPMQALMQTPIEFYGIVLDQNNKAVPAAKVEASVLDNMLKGSPITAITGADGKFTIKSKGMSLHVEVSKPGYHFVEKGDALKSSSQGFDFGIDNGKGIYRSDSSSPTIFHLRKAGSAVNLDRLVANPKVPRDGTQISISPSKTSSVALQVSCHTEEDAQAPNAPYNWKCEVLVSGGGIQEAQNEFDFVAPDEGYASSFVVNMPKTLDSKSWSSRVNKKFWLRFADGTYAKINFMMNARGDHFAVLDGYRNPTPNDRNLEPSPDTR